MLEQDFQREGARGSGVNHHNLDHCAIFGVADMSVPVLRDFTGTGLVGQVHDENVVCVVLGGSLESILKNEIVNHGLDDDRRRQHQNGADQVISTSGQLLVSPQVGVIFEPSVARVNHGQQLSIGNAALNAQTNLISPPHPDA